MKLLINNQRNRKTLHLMFALAMLPVQPLLLSAQQRDTVSWVQGTPNSKSDLIDGRINRMLIDDKHGLMALFIDADKVTKLYFGILRKADGDIDFYPDSFSLSAIQQDGSTKTLKYLKPSEVQKKLNSMSWGEAILLGLAAGAEGYSKGMGQTSTGTIYSPYGTSTVTVNTPDNRPSQSTAIAAALADQKEEEAAAKLSGVLRANTLKTGAPPVGGYIHFEKMPNKTEMLLLELSIGGRVYRIPLPINQR